MNIISPDSTFDFSTITLSSPPIKQSDGTFFTKLLNSGNPLYVQTPVGGTKNGIVTFSRHKHADLVFESKNNEFIAWGEKLEERCCTLIYEKAVEWFDSNIEPQDIDNINFFKSYKSGMYQTISTSIKKLSDNSDELIIYDETNTLKSSDCVKQNSSVISIIEICGINFSSKNFKVLIELKQLMLLDPPPVINEMHSTEDSESPFSTCLIQPHTEECSPITPSEPEIKNINLEPENILFNEPNDTPTLECINLDNQCKPITTELHEENDLKKNTLMNASLLTDNNTELNHNMNDLNIASLDIPNNNELSEPITLKPRDDIINEMYSSAKNEMERLKHEFIDATIKFENLKKEYGLN
jgi:hypothetical protein